MMVGTAAYMAPEQALGGEPDPRCDLYALGAILYEMVCGRPPFVGDSVVAVISQHINTAPIAPSWHNRDILPDLEALIVTLLAKVPDNRPKTAAIVRERLAQIAASPAPAVQPAPVGHLERRDSANNSGGRRAQDRRGPVDGAPLHDEVRVQGALLEARDNRDRVSLPHRGAHHH